MLVLDTNIIAEIMKDYSNTKVLDWLRQSDNKQLFITTINQLEVYYGIISLPQGKKKDFLLNAYEKLFNNFSERILDFDSQSSLICAKIIMKRKLIGKPISQSDAMIGAITLSNKAKLVTRNTKDFEECKIDLINPWEL